MSTPRPRGGTGQKSDTVTAPGKSAASFHDVDFQGELTAAQGPAEGSVGAGSHADARPIQ
ncbi:hypothetical protein SAMN00790413_06124 [Deinococcus hopiensis KR-140]|uniref:Uncharacterized protein n=1 Tax=Deinococcus hopiensis KR-140 TaxID=695939 RepID=A0A1W1VWD2_9DEIO|nr:hypothetical protein SAMN00790413_06124 [Deinococcus hopiensis KR-140]